MEVYRPVSGPRIDAVEESLVMNPYSTDDPAFYELDEMTGLRSVTPGVSALVSKMVGLPCLRREVGEFKSLSLGFGEVAEQTTPKRRAYRAWELGTWRSAWRLSHAGTVLCGSKDDNELSQMNQTLEQIELGRFLSLKQSSDLDIRVELDNGIVIDFLTTFSDDDESFHISCPGQIWVQFSAKGGWTVGPSNKPWSAKVA